MFALHRRLAFEWIENRLLLSASVAPDLQTVAAQPVEQAPALQASAQPASGAEGMVWLSASNAPAYGSFALYFDGNCGVNLSTGGGVFSEVRDTNAILAPTVQRILTDSEAGPARLQFGGAELGHAAVDNGGASDASLRPERIEAPRAPIWMIDITPDPAVPTTMLAKSGNPPPIAGPEKMAAAQFAPQPAESLPTSPGAAVERFRPAAEKSEDSGRAEGSQGRWQAFDLAWVAPAPGSSQRAAEVALSVAPAPAALPVVAEESTALTTPAPQDNPPAQTVSVATAETHATAIAAISDWLDAALPRLAIDAGRTRQMIPLLILATVGQHFYQSLLPDSAGPTTLVPPKRKAER